MRYSGDVWQQLKNLTADDRKRPKCTVLLSVHERVKWTLPPGWS